MTEKTREEILDESQRLMDHLHPNILEKYSVISIITTLSTILIHYAWVQTDRKGAKDNLVRYIEEAFSQLEKSEGK